MSTTLQCMVVPYGWSRAYINQLATYVRDRDHYGWHYGNKELFEKRHKEILKWVEQYENYAYEPDVKFPYERKALK